MGVGEIDPFLTLRPIFTHLMRLDNSWHLRADNLPNVVRPCCREAAALRGARHAKRGGAAAQQPRRALPEGAPNLKKIHFF